MSAIITPILKVIAALTPFVILVSINIKKTGPIKKERKKPKLAAALTSSIIIYLLAHYIYL
jgi:hypothetical protein